MLTRTDAAESVWKSPHSLEAEEKAPVALLPFPREVKWGEGKSEVTSPTDWKLVTDSACEAIMKTDDGTMITTAYDNFMAELGKHSRRAGTHPHQLSLRLDGQLGIPAEGYRLSVNAEGVLVTASDAAGLFNGLQTLRQLVLPEDGGIPYCEITDHPAFAVRAFHHDCGRNFQTIESLKHQLDLASRIKVNYFHWHLTDHPAWHVQCKAYPQLNDPAYRTRDVNDTYTYEQIRELFRYARARHITIIPELDMPGHSDYFDRAFGFPMYSEQGMLILEKLIEEFCAEVPVELCPILHFGADEVRVPNAEQFVERISRKIISLGRTPMQWEGTWDLPVGRRSIAQRWMLKPSSQRAESIRSRTVDSSIGYSNLLDPALLVRRWFFMRPCGVSAGDSTHLGAIFCTWPDIRVDDKSRIPLHNAQWPGMCAMAERAWNGCETDGDEFTVALPPSDTEAGRAFALFEKRLSAIRKSIFAEEYFPYLAESDCSWDVIGPVPDAQADAVRERVLSGNYAGLQVLRGVRGASLYFRTRAASGNLGLFPQARPGVRVWAVTSFHAPEDGEYPFILGFDAPARSNRQYTGVPFPGEWSQCGTRIRVNGTEIRNPRHYSLAGKSRIPNPTWKTPDEERPIRDEEIWWAQPPTMLRMKRGENIIIIEQPYTDEFQSWGASVNRCSCLPAPVPATTAPLPHF